MLEQAVRELRGEPGGGAEVEPEMQLGIPAYIPESYVADESQRLVIYKRLAGVRGVPDLEAIRDELVDRYGPLPPLVDTLLRLMELRRWLKDVRVLRARRRGEGIALEFDERTPVSPERVLGLVRESRGRLTVAPSGSVLEVRPEATDHDGTITELRAVLQRLSAA
jgi:transcription-repair coupling factor (superfamily II helicase)